MKWSLTLCVFLGGAVTLGWFFCGSSRKDPRTLTVNSARASSRSPRRGDVNADSGLDLSDASYRLAFLFQGVLAQEPSLLREVCDNGMDGDLDGTTDCHDLDCANDPSCRTRSRPPATDPSPGA